MNSPDRKKTKIVDRFGDCYLQRGNLRSHHHLLYAALRQRDWKAGFKPLTNKSHLNARDNEPLYCLNEALMHLETVLRLAQQKAEVASFGGELTESLERYLSRVLDPFQETVTLEMLVEVIQQIQESK